MPIEPPIIELTYRYDLNILFCRWLQAVNSSHEVKDCYYSILEKAEQERVNFILVDTRRRGYISVEDEKWILDFYFPLAESKLKGTLYYAYLVTPSMFSHIKNDVGMQLLSNYSPRTKIVVFDSEHQAMEWLKSSINVQ